MTAAPLPVLGLTGVGPVARAARAAGPLLRAVPAGRRRVPRVPFVLLVVALLTAGFVGLLLVNTSLQQGAFVAHDLERQTAALSEEHERLAERLAALEGPASLAAKAQRLGMVPMASPVFLQMPSGTILGTPRAARRADDPLRGAQPARSGLPPLVADPGVLTRDAAATRTERGRVNGAATERARVVAARAAAARAAAARTAAAERAAAARAPGARPPARPAPSPTAPRATAAAPQ